MLFIYFYILTLHVYHSKHKTFVKHLFNADPTFLTLKQHCINVIQKFVFAGLSLGYVHHYYSAGNKI